MRTLKKITALFFAMCLTFSLFCITACNNDGDAEKYYCFDSVEIEIDIEISDNSEEKEIAQHVEEAINFALADVEKTLGNTYAGRIIEDVADKLVWYTGEGIVEYDLATSTGAKRHVVEIDESAKLALSAILKEQGASITEGMRAYVEIDGDEMVLNIEIYANQMIIDNIYMKAEYEFEYKFNRTNKVPAEKE